MKIDPQLLKKSFVSVIVEDEDKEEINKKIKLLESQGVSSVKIKKNIIDKNQNNELKQIESSLFIFNYQFIY